MNTTTTVQHTWPGATWRPYSHLSPFNWQVPQHPTLDTNSTSIVRELLSTPLSGCDPKNQPTYCKPSNLVASKDGSNGGWPTYWSLASDPEISVTCNGYYCPLTGLKLRMPAGAKIQSGTTDHHLTIIDPAGEVEYDFYQVDVDRIPSSGGITVTAEGELKLNYLGQTEIPGNTNAAGFGNLAGRIRVEELQAGQINHALTIAVPCTKPMFVYPANYAAVPQECTGIGVTSNRPAMGQFLWLDLDQNGIDHNALTASLPHWGKVILSAMHNHGLIVNDNSGPRTEYFEIQVEAQAQYTSLGAGDPWLAFAKANWVPGANNDYVGALEGLPTTYEQATAWRDFWQQHLHVLSSCQLPGRDWIKNPCATNATSTAAS